MAENRQLLPTFLCLANISAIIAPHRMWAPLSSGNGTEREVAIATIDGIMVETLVELTVVSCFDAENETGVSVWRVRLAYAGI